MQTKRIELLQRMPIFGALRQDTLEFLLEQARAKAVPAGEYFFREREPADCIYVLEAGRAAVIKAWQDGEFVIRQLERGDCFGEMALMDFFPRSASVRALADCEAIALAPADLYRLFERDAEQFALIQMNMGREVCRRLRESDEQLFRARMAEATSAADFDTETVFRAT
ncbi:MAG TPA: Crp/Fnr family transcriptional regulator [Burkholderiaceae bacterium]|nr:Crp/Fnr family transcriptional regulator [Burkholderiaceae bacterium]